MIVSFFLTLLTVTLAIMAAHRGWWGAMVVCALASILSFGAFAIYLLSSGG